MVTTLLLVFSYCFIFFQGNFFYTVKAMKRSAKFKNWHSGLLVFCVVLKLFDNLWVASPHSEITPSLTRREGKTAW